LFNFSFLLFNPHGRWLQPAGHQPAPLQVHGSIGNIMASMEVLDLMKQQFIAAAQNDLMAKIASGEIATEQKRKKLLDGYVEELRVRYPEWVDLQVSLVAGPLTARRLAKSVALNEFEPTTT